MKDIMGIILTGTKNISPITDERAILALPIAGRYRIIDFVISNMANAGITNIGVATKENYSSLMDHLKSGRPWDLDRKKQGLTILPPNRSSENLSLVGNIELLAGIRDFIRRSHQTYVILSLGRCIYNIDFNKVVEEHIKNQADITAVYKNIKGSEESDLSRFVLFDVDKEKRIVDVESKPYYPKTTNASLDVYVMEKALLESIIDECIARGQHDFVKDALLQKLSGLRVFGYEFEGYTDKIDSLKAYFKNNMMFLNKEIRDELFNPENPINTKTKDLTPTKYSANAVVKNSLISDGCIIEGYVENCVLSRGVKVSKGAVIKNSIIMQDSVIDKDVELDYVVFDKEVHITEGRRMLGQSSFPLAIKKGSEI